MPVLVVGVDFSKPSKKALDAAVALAKKLEGSLVLVHATTPMPPGSRRGHLDPVTQLRAEIDAHDVAKMAATWAKQAGKSVDVTVVSRAGKPADVLLAVAKSRKALYVVVGTRGNSGIKRAVLGSVAEAVVRDSAIPVLVVPS
jgi:nucleotide-binding universal stress UspA family protein